MKALHLLNILLYLPVPINADSINMGWKIKNFRTDIFAVYELAKWGTFSQCLFFW